jgi:hypothetical protein
MQASLGLDGINQEQAVSRSCRSHPPDLQIRAIWTYVCREIE